MCFSAQADVAGGVVAGLVGMDAVRHTRNRRELGLASLPLLFGAHQLTEAFVWWGLTDRVPWTVGGAAAWLYLAVALCVLPVLTPLALLAVEPDAGRRRLLGGCAAVGLVVGAVFLLALVARPFGARSTATGSSTSPASRGAARSAPSTWWPPADRCCRRATATSSPTAS
jgi:hypothetical protein